MTRRRFATDTRGATAIEFALVAPALLMVLVGVFEVSSLILASWSLDSAAFEAARYGSTGAETDEATRAQRIGEIAASRSFGMIEIEDISVETRIFADAAAMRDATGPSDGRPGPGGPEEMVLYFVDGLWRPMTPFFARITGPVALHTRIPVMNEPF